MLKKAKTRLLTRHPSGVLRVDVLQCTRPVVSGCAAGARLRIATACLQVGPPLPFHEDRNYRKDGPQPLDREPGTCPIVCIRLALLVFLFFAWLPPVVSAATIILVRHAERISAMSADALLSPSGEERARQLSEVLKDAQVLRIYVTEVRRTQQTAAPIAARLHLTPIVIAKEDIDALVSQLRKSGADETVLVVGHADTLPLIVGRLGGGVAPAVRDNEYDRMLVVSLPPGGNAQVLTLRYGAVSQP
jgi:broad specificity phosphatase PhoE